MVSLYYLAVFQISINNLRKNYYKFAYTRLVKNHNMMANNKIIILLL